MATRGEATHHDGTDDIHEFENIVKTAKIRTNTIDGAGNAVQITETLSFNDGKNMFFSDTTGTKIGTNTTGKIAFHGATPIAQNAHIADATDAASAITQINAVILALEAKGLLASS